MKLIVALPAMKSALVLCLLAGALAVSPAATITPVPDKVVPVIWDRQDMQTPDRLQLGGWVGSRIQANEANRLGEIIRSSEEIFPTKASEKQKEWDEHQKQLKDGNN